MQHWIKTLLTSLPLMLAITGAKAAPSAAESLHYLQSQWAEIQYQLPDKERSKALEALAKDADRMSAELPAATEVLIWRGIVYSSWAGAKGGLGALGLAKEARASFERALVQDPTALDGSAYTSLGTLYYKVPGWPIGFGDDKKARTLLQQALTHNPQGIDPNYFWGDYLFEAGQYAEAKAALEKALQAAPRPGRELADEGRRGEIKQLLAKVQAKLD